MKERCHALAWIPITRILDRTLLFHEFFIFFLSFMYNCSKEILSLANSIFKSNLWQRHVFLHSIFLFFSFLSLFSFCWIDGNIAKTRLLCSSMIFFSSSCWMKMAEHTWLQNSKWKSRNQFFKNDFIIYTFIYLLFGGVWGKRLCQ